MQRRRCPDLTVIMSLGTHTLICWTWLIPSNMLLPKHVTIPNSVALGQSVCTSVGYGSQKLGKLEPSSGDGSVAATITIDYEQELVCELLKYPVLNPLLRCTYSRLKVTPTDDGSTSPFELRGLFLARMLVFL